MNIIGKRLSKIYGSGEGRVIALDKADLNISSGDFVSIMGPSGSGKSTLLHLLSGLDKPTSGNLTYDGKDIYTSPEMTKTSRPIDIDVSVKGCNDLKITHTGSADINLYFGDAGLYQ